jgi:hypothetical protein
MNSKDAVSVNGVTKIMYAQHGKKDEKPDVIRSLTEAFSLRRYARSTAKNMPNFSAIRMPKVTFVMSPPDLVPEEILHEEHQDIFAKKAGIWT